MSIFKPWPLVVRLQHYYRKRLECSVGTLLGSPDRAVFAGWGGLPAVPRAPRPRRGQPA